MNLGCLVQKVGFGKTTILCTVHVDWHEITPSPTYSVKSRGLFRIVNPGVPLHKKSWDFACANCTLFYEISKFADASTYMNKFSGCLTPMGPIYLDPWRACIDILDVIPEVDLPYLVKVRIDYYLLVLIPDWFI